MATMMLAACAGSDSSPSAPANPTVTFATAPSTTTTLGPTEPPTDESPPAASATSASPSTAAPEPTTSMPLGDPVVALSIIGAFNDPIDVAWRSGDAAAFVAERDGTVERWVEGTAPTRVLDITADTSRGSDEQGLLGLAFAPDGAHAYVNFTNNSGDTVVAEYGVGADGMFDADSRRDVLRIDQPYANHNGGNVAFGPDGMLYIGMGDGGDGGDPQRHGLNVSSLLGKILRIDPNPAEGAAYTVPDDNPFVGVPGARPEVWSVGVRNPWRMSFDSATGDLWIGDVGQNELEEVSVGWADDGGGRGVNFGWSAFEGSQRYNDDQSADGVTPPVFEYHHSNEDGCAITGGTVYRGSAIPALAGWYVFGDFCVGRLSAIHVVDRQVAGRVVLGNAPSVTAIRARPDGELWVLSLSGQVSRIVAG